jgi:hypothetical protein
MLLLIMPGGANHDRARVAISCFQTIYSVPKNHCEVGFLNKNVFCFRYVTYFICTAPNNFIVLLLLERESENMISRNVLPHLYSYIIYIYIFVAKIGFF